MSAATFDRHIYIKKFIAKGMSEELAEEVTDAIKLSKDADFSNLATKADLKAEVQEVRTEIAELKAEIIKWMFGGFISVIGLLTGVIGLTATILVKMH